MGMTKNNLHQPDAEKGNSGLFPSPYRRSILLFCVCTFFFWGALCLYVPILPVYARSLGASLSMVGIIVASYGIPQLVFRIPIGVWFDSLNRHKPLVAVGIVIASLGAAGLGMVSTLWFFFGARAVTGLGVAMWVIFTIYFTAYYPGESAGRAIGIINFISCLASVVATVGGGVVAEVWGFKATFWGAAVLGILSFLTLLATREPTIPRIREPVWNNLPKVAFRPLLLVVSFMGILLHFTACSNLGFIPVYSAEIGASNVDLGIIIMMFRLATAIASLIAIYMVERWGYSFTLMSGALLAGVSLAVTPFIETVHMLELWQLSYGMGWGVLSAIFMTLSIKAVPPHQRATAMGMYQAMYAAGILSGPLVSGFLADNYGLATVFYLSSALCVVIAVMAFLPILRRTKN